MKRIRFIKKPPKIKKIVNEGGKMKTKYFRLEKRLKQEEEIVSNLPVSIHNATNPLLGIFKMIFCIENILAIRLMLELWILLIHPSKDISCNLFNIKFIIQEHVYEDIYFDICCEFK